MSDDLFTALTRSPLDPEPGDSEKSWFEWSGFAVGLIVSLVATSLAAVLVRESKTPVTSIVAAPSTTGPVAPADPEPLYPPGYIEVVPGVALRPELIYPVADQHFVVLSTSVRSDVSAIETPVFEGGLWTATALGTEVVFDGEVRNPEALGMIGVAFTGLPGGEVSSVSVRPVVSETTATERVSVTIDGLPAATDEIRFQLEDGIVLVIDSIALGPESGVVEWRIDGREARGQIGVTLSFPEADPPDADNPRVMVSEHLAPPYPFQRPAKPTPVPTRGGVDVVRLVGDAFVEPEALTTAELELEITWQRYSEAAVSIPVALG